MNYNWRSSIIYRETKAWSKPALAKLWNLWNSVSARAIEGAYSAILARALRRSLLTRCNSACTPLRCLCTPELCVTAPRSSSYFLFLVLATTSRMYQRVLGAGRSPVQFRAWCFAGACVPWDQTGRATGDTRGGARTKCHVPSAGRNGRPSSC